MIIKPIVSEKAIYLTDEGNTYAFYVPKTASKNSIAEAVSRQFKVEVGSVRTIIVKGKPKQMRVRRGRRIVPGRRQNLKKAYVTLKQGSSIGLFEGSE